MWDLESDKIQNDLTILVKHLNKARSLINLPCLEKFTKAPQQFPVLLEIIDKDHRKLLACKVLIERHKEEQERKWIEMVCPRLVVFNYVAIAYCTLLEFHSVLG